MPAPGFPSPSRPSTPRVPSGNRSIARFSPRSLSAVFSARPSDPSRLHGPGVERADERARRAAREQLFLGEEVQLAAGTRRRRRAGRARSRDWTRRARVPSAGTCSRPYTRSPHVRRIRATASSFGYRVQHRACSTTCSMRSTTSSGASREVSTTAAPSGFRSGASARSRVLAVAPRHVLGDGGHVHRHALGGEVPLAPPRARVEIRVEVELHLGDGATPRCRCPAPRGSPRRPRRARAAAGSSCLSPAPAPSTAT